MERKQVPLTRPKNGVPGPSDMSTARYPPLTGQTQPGWPWTGQQADGRLQPGHRAPELHHPRVNVKNVKKRDV